MNDLTVWVRVSRMTPRLNQYVDKAIAQTVKDHPELFDLNHHLLPCLLLSDCP